MRWCSPNPGGKPGSWTHTRFFFHDLVDDADVTIGWVREDRSANVAFVPMLAANAKALFPAQNTLEEAKTMLLTYIIARQLETME